MLSQFRGLFLFSCLRLHETAHFPKTCFNLSEALTKCLRKMQKCLVLLRSPVYYTAAFSKTNLLGNPVM